MTQKYGMQEILPLSLLMLFLSASVVKMLLSLSSFPHLKKSLQTLRITLVVQISANVQPVDRRSAQRCPPRRGLLPLSRPRSRALGSRSTRDSGRLASTASAR